MNNVLSKAQWDELFDVKLQGVELEPLKSIVATICGNNMSFAVQLHEQLVAHYRALAGAGLTGPVRALPASSQAAAAVSVGGYIMNDSSVPTLSLSHKRARSEQEINPSAGCVQQASADKRLKAYHQSLLMRCKQCGDMYDKVDDAEKECKWHKGTLEMDDNSDLWDVLDDWHLLADDDLDRRIDEPEGLIWTCCQTSGTDDHKCMTAKHSYKGMRRSGREDMPTHYAEIETHRHTRGPRVAFPFPELQTVHDSQTEDEDEEDGTDEY